MNGRKKRFIAMTFALLALTACGSYADDTDENDGNVTNDGGFFNRTSPLGVVIECIEFQTNVECWPVEYP
jgi:hypothetical protein